MMPTGGDVDEEGRPTEVLQPFSFLGRRYLRSVYDTPAKRVLLMCGRQVEKSTTLGNLCLSYMVLRRHFRTLFVSPTEQQTLTFSRDKIATPILLSPKLKAFSTGKDVQSSATYKKFNSHSDITMRYAFLHADRIRGISADMLLIDEIQDILTDVIPVIEQALSHSRYKIYRYSGTPKTLDNTICKYWENRSTQNEWVIPCDSCGGGDYRYWNVCDEDNIDVKNRRLMCDKCSAPLNARHESARWASMNPNPKNVVIPFEGFRVPQLIVSWADWDEIIDRYLNDSPALFWNEVLGKGYDSGERPISKATMRACSDPNISMMASAKRRVTNPVYMGVDWGGGTENSYTVITLGTYMADKFTIFVCHRLTGKERDPDLELQIIDDYVRKYNPKLIGIDFAGFKQRERMLTKYGRKRVIPYQYAATNKKLTSKRDRIVVARHSIIEDIINAINRKDIFRFPKWEEFEELSADFYNMIAEYNDRRNMYVFTKSPDNTDDAFHSFIYCFLASMIRHPRPDILIPDNRNQGR